MTGHRLALQVDGGIVIIRGWKASGTLRCAGLRPTYSGAAGGWMVDVARLPELLAWLDDRRFAYAIEGDRPESAAGAKDFASAQAPEPTQVGHVSHHLVAPEPTLW